MRAPSILHFISSLRGGGAEQHLVNLCVFLSSSGCPVTVCALSREAGALEGRIAAAGARLERLSLGSLRDCLLPRVRRRLRSIVARAHPDVIHAHLYHAEIVAALAAGSSGAPLVVTRHSGGLEFGGHRRFAARAAARRIRLAIAVSEEAAAEAVRTGIPARRVTVVPNSVDTTVFRPFEPELREQERAVLLEQQFGDRTPAGVLIGALGGLKPVKNFPGLLHAFADLRRGRTGAPPSRLIIFGEGPCRGELEEIAAGLGLEGAVSLPGRVERPEGLLPLLDIFALPSLSEGVPLALVEAMSCGLACVASEVGGIGPALGGAGILVPPGDTRALGAALAGLIADEGERARLGRLARVRAMERFDLPAWGERILGLYRELLG